MSYQFGPFVIGGALPRHEPNIAAAGKAADYQAQNQYTYGAACESGALRFAGGYMRTDTDTDTAKPSVTQQTENLWLGGSYDATTTVSLTAAHYRTTLSGDLVGCRSLDIVSVT